MKGRTLALHFSLKKHLGVSLGLSLLALAGCKAGFQASSDTAMAEVALMGKQVFAGKPGVSAVQPKDGMANPRVRLQIRDGLGAPAFKLQALPSAWSQAVINLHNPSVNAAFTAGIHSKAVTYDTSKLSSAWTQAVAVGGLNLPWDVAVSGQLLFATNTYAASPHVVVYNTTTNTAVTTVGAGTLSRPMGLTYAAGKVYVADNGTGQIKVIDDTTFALTTLATAAIPGIRDVAVIGTKLYASDSTNNRIISIDLTTGVQTVVVSGGPMPYELAVYGAILYFAAPLDNSVWAHNTSNGAAARAYSGLVAPQGVAIRNDTLYVSNTGGNTITTIDIPTGNRSTAVATGATSPIGIATTADGGFYYANHGGNQITRVNPPNTYTTTVPFPPLRPANNYTAQVFLKRADGSNLTLSGSQTRSINLVSGVNNLLFNVDLNGNEATFSAANNDTTINQTTANTLVKGDALTLATGLDANQPGVAKVVTQLSGAAYNNNGTGCVLGVSTAAASWNSLAWNSATNGSDTFTPPAGVLIPAYEASKLMLGVATGTIDPTPATVTVNAYDVYNQLVGSASFTIQVYGVPEVQLQLQ